MGWLDETLAKRRERQERLADDAQVVRAHGRGIPGSLDPGDFVIVTQSAHHLGGFGALPLGDIAALWLNCTGIGADNLHGKFFMGWADIAGLDVTDRLEAKSRLGATVVFGVAALGAKDRQTVAEIHIRQTSGAIAAFAIEGMSAAAVRARISPTLASVDVPLDSVSRLQTGSVPADLVSQLERLAALHASGAITDDEFADFKRQLRESDP